MIDVVVPTVAGREESLNRCLESYQLHTHSDQLNFIVIRDEPTCGLAWKEGMKSSSGEFVHLTCDDIEVTDKRWAKVCIKRLNDGFLPCPIVRRPDGTIESCGGDRQAKTRLVNMLQPDGTEVDFTVLPFITQELASKIGMIEAHYMTDVWVSVRARQMGWDTVVTHGYEAIHHHESAGRRDSSKARRNDRRIFKEEIECVSL